MYRGSSNYCLISYNICNYHITWLGIFAAIQVWFHRKPCSATPVILEMSGSAVTPYLRSQLHQLHSLSHHTFHPANRLDFTPQNPPKHFLQLDSGYNLQKSFPWSLLEASVTHGSWHGKPRHSSPGCVTDSRLALSPNSSMAAIHWETRLRDEDAANNFPVVIPFASCIAAGQWTTALSTKFTSAEEHMACAEYRRVMWVCLKMVDLPHFLNHHGTNIKQTQSEWIWAPLLDDLRPCCFKAFVFFRVMCLPERDAGHEDGTIRRFVKLANGRQLGYIAYRYIQMWYLHIPSGELT